MNKTPVSVPATSPKSLEKANTGLEGSLSTHNRSAAWIGYSYSPVNIDGPEVGVLSIVKCVVVHKLATYGRILANSPRNLRTHVSQTALRPKVLIGKLDSLRRRRPWTRTIAPRRAGH